MAATATRSFWTSARRAFRWLRIALLIGLLAVVGFLFYWNQTGLPDFLKRAVLTQLRQHGVDLEFKSIRFRWDRGIVAEQVKFGRTHLTFGPGAQAEQVVVGIEPGALLRGQLQVDKLLVYGGEVTWNFTGTNQAPLALQRINAKLFFRPGDCWDLESFAAQFQGVQLAAAGTLTNGSRLDEMLGGSAGATNRPAGEAPDAALRRFAHALTNYQFAYPPSISVRFRADATNANAWAGDVRVEAGQMTTPYGRLRDAGLTINFAALPQKNGDGRVNIQVEAESITTAWGGASKLKGVVSAVGQWDGSPTPRVSLNATCRAARTPWGRGEQVELRGEIDGTRTNLDFQVRNLRSAWGAAGAADIQAQLSPGGTNGPGQQLELTAKLRRCTVTNNVQAEEAWLQASCVPVGPEQKPAAVRAEGHLVRLQTPWGTAREAQWRADLARQTNDAPLANQEAWATNVRPWTAAWKFDLQGLETQGLALASLRGQGSWAYPVLTLSGLNGVLGGGEFGVTGRLDTVSRQVSAELAAGIDLHLVEHLLGTNVQRWLAPLSCAVPPKLAGRVSATLPPGNPPATNWLAQILPGLAGEGRLDCGAVKYNGVALQSIQMQCAYSNETWSVADLALNSEQGWLRVKHEGNPKTGEYSGHVRSLLDPRIVRPLLDEKAQRAFELVALTSAPEVEAEIRARWRERLELEVTGQVRATNLTFRGQSIGRLETAVRYADHVLTFTHPRVERVGERAEADLVVVDFNAQKVFLTNAVGNIEPHAVATAIGQHIVKIIKPYQFLRPPLAHVEGVIPMWGEKDACLRFDLAGGPFRWSRFNTTNIVGTVWWLEKTIVLTNVTAEFYGGQLTGDAVFDVGPNNSTPFQMRLNVTNMQFQPFMKDISTTSNSVAGALSGELVVTRADAEDWRSWNGYGWVTMRDGLIWDMPIFGIFSPVLNGMAPGLGNSRAKSGAATYVITNSVVFSDDLEILASKLRLHYSGTVDFEYNVNAHVEAELLRDTFLVGPVLSLALKPLTKVLEYKVTGTLENPKSQPLYLPKFLLAPLHPLSTLRELFSFGATNHPPELKQTDDKKKGALAP